MQERVRWLWANDPEWRRRKMEASFRQVRAAYDTGPGYGHCSIASNGMWCASWPEREMCEWLIDRAIEFEMHKPLGNGKMCDFYFDGVYWEMDGLDRAPEFFEAKYGDLPYVVVTPEDFRFRVDRHLATAHAENGDPIVAIEPYGYESTYDVEMAPDGPLNFLANGIVSHNSHAACYGLIAYRTAWLKANHPAEYMAALISSVMSTKDKVPFFVARCEEMGIEILPPDVNLSDHEFTVVEGNIRFGLDAVKGVGHQAVEAMKAAREDGGPFESLWDFCSRVDCRAVNKKAIEALVKCGAFGSTGASRKGMLLVLEAAQAAGSKQQQDAQVGQGSIFDLGGTDDAGAPAFAAPAHPPIPPDEFEQAELLAVEKESIGLFISAHPLKEVREALRAKCDCTIAEIEGKRDQEWVTIGGIVTQARKFRTKTGSQMMFATLDDLEGSVELVAFERTLNESEGALAVDEIVLVRGRVDHKDASKTCVIVQSAAPFKPTAAEVEKAREAAQAVAAVVALPLHLHLDAAQLPASVIDELRSLLGNFPGESEVVLELRTTAGARKLRLGPEFRVTATPALRAELDHVLGPAALPAA
jgi:DNA polymerase-3 subunit alpha